MRIPSRSAVAGALVALAACSDPPAGPVDAPLAPDGAPLLAAAPGAQAIPDQYIVVLRAGADARGLAAQADAIPDHVYEAALNGFAARLRPAQVEALRRNPQVEYVEQDQVVTVATTQTGATWGIDRIDQRSLPLSGSYTYTRTGSGVTAYVIDTGIDAGHSQFGGRASSVYDALGGSGNDCNGHGTHVAGTIGGSTYGVAKGVRLRGVRVLGCSGSGSISGIIAGVDWVRRNAARPAVANLSLGGGLSSSLNTAVASLVTSGVFVAVAAGNSNANACSFSPAAVPSAYTVAATTSNDSRASYSNYGSCVDGYAPGSSITSAWIGGGTTETRSISGTSMASPHVAGVAALYLQGSTSASPSTVSGWINSNATGGVVRSNPTGTPNRLLYKATL